MWRDKKGPRICFSLILLFSLAGCTQTLADRGSAPPCEISSFDWTETQLYFGLNIPGKSGDSAGGSVVSDALWADFVSSVVTPKFKDGFTVLDARGYWGEADSDITVNEGAKLLVIVHPRTNEHDATIVQIADAYRVRFNQDAVMIAAKPLKVRFCARPDASEAN